MQTYLASMVLHLFEFIDIDEIYTFDNGDNKAPAMRRTTAAHNANQVWAFSIAVQCATASSGNWAWDVLYYHLLVDFSHQGHLKRRMLLLAHIYHNGDLGAVIEDAKALFRLAREKCVIDDSWLANFDAFDMHHVAAGWYAYKQYCYLERLHESWLFQDGLAEANTALNNGSVKLEELWEMTW